MYKIYGIPNCDTVKKATNWLKERNVLFEFHDYKKEGITAARLKEWNKQVGLETFLNKKSTTWRELGADQQALAASEKTAIKLLVENPSMIKRPVIENGENVVLVGFDEKAYGEQFGG